jgi:hypothetical protein
MKIDMHGPDDTWSNWCNWLLETVSIILLLSGLDFRHTSIEVIVRLYLSNHRGAWRRFA